MIPEKPSDYFAYKKNKMQSSSIKQEKKPISKFSFLCQLFLATFVVIFIVIVFIFMKYSQKMGVEYFKGDLSHDSSEEISYEQENDEKGKIDKRLMLIQQEENAPSAKVVLESKQGPDVIDAKIIENSQKEQKIEEKLLKEKEKEQLLNSSHSQKEKTTLKEIIEEMKPSKTPPEPTSASNVTIMSKVLIGKFGTFEEAQEMQKNIKTQHPTLSPYVRKMGEVYSVQMGSYQDFSIAKAQAQKLKAKGFEVWIYQQ